MLKKLKHLSTRLGSSFEMNSLAPSQVVLPQVSHSLICHGPRLSGGIEAHSSSAPVAESSSMAAKRQHSGNLENPSPTKKARTILLPWWKDNPTSSNSRTRR
jgi:hypothetical protein